MTLELCGLITAQLGAVRPHSHEAGFEEPWCHLRGADRGRVEGSLLQQGHPE